MEGDIVSFQKGNKINLGRKYTEEQKKNLSVSHLGQIPWNKGLTQVLDSRIKRKPLKSNAGYFAIHQYIKKQKPKSAFCSICKKTVKLYLAFKDDTAGVKTPERYTRNPDDYSWMCNKCHMKRDGRIEQLRRMGQNKTWKTSGMFGKKHTNITKKKISDSKKARRQIKIDALSLADFVARQKRAGLNLEEIKGGLRIWQKNM